MMKTKTKTNKKVLQNKLKQEQKNVLNLLKQIKNKVELIADREVHWGHVGDMQSYQELLKQIVNC